MKEYLKPEIDYVSLIADEAITNDLIDGSLGLEDSDF